MEQLLEMAKKVCDKVDIFSVDKSGNVIIYKNQKLHEIRNKFQFGISIRVIKNGKLGFAYTKNLLDRSELLQNALDTLKAGVDGNFDFPLTDDLPQLSTYDDSIENLDSAAMVEECSRVSDILKNNTGGDVRAYSYSDIETTRILNSEGTDISSKNSYYGSVGISNFPGAGNVGFYRFMLNKKYAEFPQTLIDELSDLYSQSVNKIITPKGGKMNALFMPNSMETLIWRLASGTSAKSVYGKSSPIESMLGKKIFDERVTFSNMPLDDNFAGARTFDDEGVACTNFPIIENGVLRNFYNDLDYASKSGSQSTGHGYRTTFWGGDPTTLKPIPALRHNHIKPGDKSLAQLIKQIDRGILIESALGSHSGNIPNGDFSIGACPGLYIENGEIVGRVKNAMISGNVYELFKHVVDIGGELYHYYDGGHVPAILFDDVSVATKS